MNITVDQLRTRYESLPTEELLTLLTHGDLTQEAEVALAVELRARGYADRDSGLRAGVALAEAEAREAPDPFRSRHAAHFAMLAVSVLFSIVAACFSSLAPFIWRSPADHVCQKAGYWYATDSGLTTQVSCFGWKGSELPLIPNQD
jgi:hypothetical protein